MIEQVSLQREHGHHGRTTISMSREMFVRKWGEPHPHQMVEWMGTTWRVLMAVRSENVDINARFGRAEASR